MTKLTKQEVLKTIKLIDLGEYENSLVEFFEDIDELILNVTKKKKKILLNLLHNKLHLGIISLMRI